MRLLSLYPPYLGAGIRVRAAADLRTFEVRMKLGRFNRNYVGTQFGGSLYSMCDPFFMLILAEALGRGYIVWDKAATIRFRRPGRGPCAPPSTSRRSGSPRSAPPPTRRGRSSRPSRSPCSTTPGEVVAEVEKLLYVRKKEADRRRAAGSAAA